MDFVSVAFSENSMAKVSGLRYFVDTETHIVHT